MAKRAAAAKKTTKKENPMEKVIIGEPLSTRFSICLVGTATYVVNQFADKARRNIRDKQQGKGPIPKIPKDPFLEGILGAYVIDDDFKLNLAGAHYGIPRAQFKGSIRTVPAMLENITKAKVNRVVRIPGHEYVKIEGDPPIMREDPVRLKSGPGAGVADLRYRYAWEDLWWVEFEVETNPLYLPVATIVNLFQWAGKYIGVGEHRYDKGGEWGGFRVATQKEHKELQKNHRAEPRTQEHIDKHLKLYEDYDGLYTHLRTQADSGAFAKKGAKKKKEAELEAEASVSEADKTA